MLMAARPGLWRRQLPHVVERYLESLNPWADEKPPKGRPEVHITPQDRAHALEVTEKVEGSALVALCPGAKWPAKQWPAERYSLLAESLVREDFGVILLGSRDEEPLLEKVAFKVSKKDHVMVLTENLRLLASAFFISTVSVCNDSGLMHLSAAVGTPTIAIFGPTAPHLGFRPYGDVHKVLWLGLDCSPCSLHGEKACRKSKDVPCMSLLESNQVLTALRPLLEVASTGQGRGSETIRRDSQCGT
jgi:lipopolysaccharide heptosyltransferase II